MKVYNYHVDNKIKLSEDKLRDRLNFQESSYYPNYDFNKLKDLKEFDFYSLLTIKEGLEKKNN